MSDVLESGVPGLTLLRGSENFLVSGMPLIIVSLRSPERRDCRGYSFAKGIGFGELEVETRIAQPVVRIRVSTCRLINLRY